MEPKKHLVLDHPIIFGIVGPVAAFVLATLISALSFFVLDLFDFLSKSAVESIAGSIAYALTGTGLLALLKARLAPNYRFYAHNDRLPEALGLLWFYYIVCALNAVPDIIGGTELAASGLELVLIIISNMFVGYFEETVCRGAVISNSMRVWKDKPNKVVWSAVLSAIPFGLLHLTNYSVDGESAILQTVYAMAFGALFAAVYLRTRNLLSCALVHGLVDVTADLFAAESNASGLGLESIIFIAALTVTSLAVACFLLRPSKSAEAARRFDALGD